MNSAEKAFKKFWEAQGKSTYVERMHDAADNYGLTNGKTIAAFKQTSDWIVVHRGTTFWAEVKQCEGLTRFPFSNIRPHQLGRARMIRAAGGNYDFFIHSIALDVWFRVPCGVIIRLVDAGAKSVTWEDLGGFTWLP